MASSIDPIAWFTGTRIKASLLSIVVQELYNYRSCTGVVVVVYSIVVRSFRTNLLRFKMGEKIPNCRV